MDVKEENRGMRAGEDKVGFGIMRMKYAQTDQRHALVADPATEEYSYPTIPINVELSDGACEKLRKDHSSHMREVDIGCVFKDDDKEFVKDDTEKFESISMLNASDSEGKNTSMLTGNVIMDSVSVFIATVRHSLVDLLRRKKPLPIDRNELLVVSKQKMRRMKREQERIRLDFDRFTLKDYEESFYKNDPKLQDLYHKTIRVQPDENNLAPVSPYPYEHFLDNSFILAKHHRFDQNKPRGENDSEPPMTNLIAGGQKRSLKKRMSSELARKLSPILFCVPAVDIGQGINIKAAHNENESDSKSSCRSEYETASTPTTIVQFKDGNLNELPRLPLKERLAIYFHVLKKSLPFADKNKVSEHDRFPSIFDLQPGHKMPMKKKFKPRANSDGGGYVLNPNFLKPICQVSSHGQQVEEASAEVEQLQDEIALLKQSLRAEVKSLSKFMDSQQIEYDVKKMGFEEQRDTEELLREQLLEQQEVCKDIDMKVKKLSALRNLHNYVSQWGQMHLYFRERNRRKIVMGIERARENAIGPFCDLPKVKDIELELLKQERAWLQKKLDELREKSKDLCAGGTESKVLVTKDHEKETSRNLESSPKLSANRAGDNSEKSNGSLHDSLRPLKNASMFCEPDYNEQRFPRLVPLGALSL